MKKKLCFILIFMMLLLLPQSVLAIDYYLNVGDEDIYVNSGTKQNSDGTAKWDATSKILTLNGYNDGNIETDIDDILVIKLVDINKVDGDGSGGIITDNGLEITGEGSLEITNVESGIFVDDGNIIIRNTTLNINNTDEFGIATIDGDIGITDSYIKFDSISYAGLYTENGNINIKDSNIEMDNVDGEGIYASTSEEDNNGNVVIDSDVNITSNDGIYAYGILTINGGNIKINSEFSGTMVQGYILNGGKVTVNSNFLGIGSYDTIKINGGYTHITAGEEGSGVAIFSISEETPTFLISDNMEILPKGLSLQSTIFKFIDDDSYNGVTVGTDGIKIDLESDTPFVNIANEVIIEEKNPNTYDDIYKILIVLGISILGIIALFKFNKSI